MGFLFCRKLVISMKRGDRVFIFLQFKRALCQTESKAFSKSKRIICVTLFLFISRVMCFITRCSC